ncbi:hypothetical protein ANN_21541 [Periplaneta americana]|uniref:Uncharacterized protein n=1 Tax=Periplaneta americana TaxID=6978 RepID=A0ABQ8S5R0_PERAM|nr:hypothetical protein ANN_21541 [Periplaneta americana]
MAGLCEGGNEPPGSLKASNSLMAAVLIPALIASAGSNLKWRPARDWVQLQRARFIQGAKVTGSFRP